MSGQETCENCNESPALPGRKVCSACATWLDEMLSNWDELKEILAPVRSEATPARPATGNMECGRRMPYECHAAGCPDCSTARCPWCLTWWRAPRGHDPLKHHMDYCEAAPEDEDPPDD